MTEEAPQTPLQEEADGVSHDESRVRTAKRQSRVLTDGRRTKTVKINVKYRQVSGSPSNSRSPSPTFRTHSPVRELLEAAASDQILADVKQAISEGNLKGAMLLQKPRLLNCSICKKTFSAAPGQTSCRYCTPVTESNISVSTQERKEKNRVPITSRFESITNSSDLFSPPSPPEPQPPPPPPPSPSGHSSAVKRAQVRSIDSDRASPDLVVPQESVSYTHLTLPTKA